MMEQITESSAENNEIINNNVALNEDTNSTRGGKQEVSDPLLEPLREEEKAAIKSTSKKDDVRIIAPVPDDAPAIDKTEVNSSGKEIYSYLDYFNTEFDCEHSKIFSYQNAEGQLMGYIVRWDNVKQKDGSFKKETRPYAWCEYQKGKYRWQSKGLPLPPLYNLPEIISRSDAPILIVEGEKNADAAKLLFPELAVTTTMFGAQSPHKTDWSPVKGRSVIICSDFDDAGTKYGDAVYGLSRKASCGSVKLLDIKKLVKETLGKELDALRDQGYDLADACADGLTKEILDDDGQALKSWLSYYFTQTQIKSQSLPKGFRLNENSQIEYEAMIKIPEIGEIPEWRWLSSYIMITHQMRNEKSNGWSRIAEVIDSGGKHKKIIISMTELAGDGTDLRKLLLDEGVSLSTASAAKQKLLEYINLSFPKKTLLYVTKIGWTGRHYILPDKVYGDHSKEETQLNVGGKLPEFKQSGTLQEWHQHIGNYAIDNSRVQMAIFIALAAPILKLLGRENFGVHFVGASSIGKSTVSHVACSVYGSEFRSWRTTDNSAESWGLSSNDNLLALDDMGQASADAVAQMTYMLGNGQGKGRADKKGVARGVTKFTICFISTGEIGVEQKLRESKGKLPYYAGQAVRLLEIPADAAMGHGIFDVLHNLKDGEVLSTHFKDACKQYQGTLGDQWLTYLSEHQDEAVNLVRELEKKASQVMKTEEKADGQIVRAKSNFALMAAAGEAAISKGFLKWPEGSSIRACAEIFNAWIQNRGGVESHEDIQLINDTKIFLQQDSNARFEIIDNGCEQQEAANPDTKKTIYRQAGFKKLIESKWVMYVFTDVFDSEVIKSRNKTASLKALVEKGYLNRDEKHFAKLKRLPGFDRKRVYVMQLPIDE